MAVSPTVATGIGGLRVVEVDPQADPRWAAFVAAHPAGLIYHHPAWLRVLEREYGQRPVGLVCQDAAGALQGVLPLLPTRGLPLHRGRPRGPRLASLPRTEVAGPLAHDRRAATALVKVAVERARCAPGRLLQLTTTDPDLDGSVGALTRTAWHLAYVLHLPGRPEDLRFGNSRNHAQIKRAANKAARSGVEVRPAKTEAELRAWYRLYLETLRWHVGPPRPYRFFAAIWHELRPSGMARLLLAVHTQGGERRLLAGSLYLMFGRTVFYAFNGRRGDDLSLRPNDAIHWRAIYDACAGGFHRYSFGETSEDNPGLNRFKSKWGTTTEQLYRYYSPWPAGGRAAGFDGTDPGVPRPTGRAHQLATNIWRRLPLPVTALAGEVIYRYL